MEAAAAKDSFDAVAIKPWRSYFKEATTTPAVPRGQPTIDTFNDAQVKALHAAYWDAPPTADLAAMLKLAFKAPAFKGRTLDDSATRAAGRLFAKLPESFPWGWRSRVLSATSHATVQALLTTPAGAPLQRIFDTLAAEHPGFPVAGGLRRAAAEAWVAEPDRFPFAKLLKRDKTGGYLFEPQGKTALPGVRTDGLGRFVVTPELAQRVRTLCLDSVVQAHWSDDDLAAHVGRTLAGAVDGADAASFTRRSLQNLRTTYPKVVPTAHDVQRAAMERLAKNVRDIWRGGETTTLTELKAVLFERYGTPIKAHNSDFGHLRSLFPDIVPAFREEKLSGNTAEAETFRDAILQNPGKPYLTLGRELGHEDARTQDLMGVIRRRWPDAVPAQEVRRYGAAEKQALREVWRDAPLDADAGMMLRIFKAEHPDVAEAFPFASAQSFYQALREQLDAPPLAQRKQEMYGALLADAARRSRPGTSLQELTNMIRDEHRGAYSMSNVKRLLKDVRQDPDKHPALTRLLEEHKGEFPWERSTITQTRELAERVKGAIEDNPGKPLRVVAAALLQDKAFARAYPTFNAQHIHYLRATWPDVVPYVDDLGPVAGDRFAARHEALKVVAKAVQKYADGHDDPGGLTLSGIARAINEKPHRVRSAIQHAPELFPWYSERESGTADLYLATRVAHAIEQAPMGAQWQQLCAALKEDPAFTKRYPTFNDHTLAALRASYPEIVPHVFDRDRILRSAALTDALITAPKGTPFSDVVKQLETQHPGMFSGTYADEHFVRRLWSDTPEKFPFADVLKDKRGEFQLVGQGKALPPKKESTATLATRLAKLDRIPTSLPLIDKIVDLAHKDYFGDYEVIAIQHMLGSQVPLFDALRKLGVKPDRTSVVAIPYSTSQPVVDVMRDKGWNVSVPPLDLDAWYVLVKDAMEERIAAAEKGGRKVLVLDDGGLMLMLMEKYPHLQEKAHLFQIVEQTRRGITVADGAKDLRAPIVNVAQSWGKYVEGPMIGNSVQDKLQTRLAGIGIDDIKGKHIGVIGYGTIGGPLADFLKSQGAKVTVLDAGDEARDAARKAGLAVKSTSAKDRQAFFSQQDIIVGATGMRSMTPEDLDWLKDGAVIGSASSKLVEIDVDHLGKQARRAGVKTVDAESHPPSVSYAQKDGRAITLLAKGFPLNFDGSVEDIDAERIQLTRALMLIGALQAAGASAAGVHRLDPTLQLTVLGALDGVTADVPLEPAVRQASTLAQVRLTELSRRRGTHDSDRRHGAR